MSKQELADRVRNRTLIGCQLASGSWVYPAWQFTDDATVDRHILQVWQLLREHTDPWTALLWMCAPIPHLENPTAVQYLANGGDGHLDAVLAAARTDAAGWTA